MQRSQALVIVTSQLRHVCPYKGQDVLVALCYRKAQDIEERDFCYGCDVVPLLKRKFGLRTFKRRIVLSRCRHCDEPATLHSPEAPHLCSRISRCPGFEPMVDQTGVLYVATNAACTEWMVVDNLTGERKTLAEFKHDKRFRLPLLGAPGTVPSDGADERREEAADEAARRRSGRGAAREDDEPTNTTVKVKRGRKKTS